ncbi:MAG: hypothetical protein ABI298_00625 [Acidimicrobiales bacterium]
MRILFAGVFFATETLHSSTLMYELIKTRFDVGSIVSAVGSSKVKQGRVSLEICALRSTHCQRHGLIHWIG